MSSYDDAHEERFRRSAWWKAPPTEPTNWEMRALLEHIERDDPLTVARRRRELLAELAAVVDEEAG